MKKSYKISISLALLLVPLAIGLTFMLPSTNEDFILPDLEPFDIGPELRSIDYGLRSSKFEGGNNLKTSDNSYYAVGDILDWYVSDDTTFEVFFEPYKLRAIGTLTEIWVQVDLSYPDNRETPVITDDQISYILDEFETNIYPTDVLYFGAPDFHDGSEADLVEEGIVPPGTYYEENGRNVVLVSNVRDESYYDKSYPYYVAGFYWTFFENEFDRNIITIDCHDWDNRLGPDRYMYDAIFAHEYQHLIHDDWNPEDDLFMNEGCSMYAEPLCGYPIDWDSINSYLYTPDNSLTVWEDQGNINTLADYGQALLWSIYLSDHFGGSDFISYFVQAGIPGIPGINNALAHFGYSLTFDDVFHDWRIANLIHTDQIGDGKYNYVSIDLGGLEADDARTYDIKRPWFPVTTGSDFGETTTILHQKTGLYMIDSYGTDYIMLTGLKQFSSELIFDGDDVANPLRWRKDDQDGDGDYEWYSTSATPESDDSLTAIYPLPNTEEVIMTIDTNYDIEEFWDFGFVQVSNDGGTTWTSIANGYTTDQYDPDAHPDIIANLPGLTGSSGGWVTMDFDLSAYKNQEVILNFRYMTDWAFQEPGWWIDNIRINGELIDDADDVILFEVAPLPETDFMVDLISVSTLNGVQYTQEYQLIVDDLNEIGTVMIEEFMNEEGYVLIFVSPLLGPTDYSIELTRA